MRYLIVFIFAVILSGCGEEKIPPPPTAHALLVKKLFNNLAKKEHLPAVKRIQKVRALDSSNEFLIELEEREFCNYYIKRAQKKLDANNLLKAIAIINIAMKKYPLSRNLLAIDTELKQLKALQKHIKLLNSADSSKRMHTQINAVTLFIKKYPEGKILLPTLRKKIKKAFQQNLYEHGNARFDLLCDLKDARKAKRLNQNLNDTLLAILTTSNIATVNKKERTKADLLD